MNSKSAVCLFFLLCAAQPLFSQTKEDVFRMDTYSLLNQGDSKEMVSIYWEQIARRLIRSGHWSGASPEVLEQLKEILAPVDSLSDLAYTFPKNSPDRSRLLKESRRLVTSGKPAQSVFDCIGTEFAIELALKNNSESTVASLESLGTMGFLKWIEEKAIGQAGLISDQRLNQLKAIFEEAETPSARK